MNVPNEFAELFQGIDLTKREIAFLIWLTEWDQNTIRNMRTVLEKVRAAGVADGSIPQPSNEPLTQADLNKMYLNEVWLEYPDGSGETALVVLGKLYDTSSLEGAGLDLEEYTMGETLNNPTGNYKVYRRPPEGEKEKT